MEHFRGVHNEAETIVKIRKEQGQSKPTCSQVRRKVLPTSRSGCVKITSRLAEAAQRARVAMVQHGTVTERDAESRSSEQICGSQNVVVTKNCADQEAMATFTCSFHARPCGHRSLGCGIEVERSPPTGKSFRFARACERARRSCMGGREK